MPKSKGACSLFDQLMKKGSLSEKQIAAIRKSIEREAGWAAERKVKDAAKTTDGLERLVAIFTTVGQRKAVLRLDGGYQFNIAPDSGVNAGHVYVKKDGEYCGKITPEGTFRNVRNCPAEVTEFLMELEGDEIVALAIAYGKNTGRCACCGRELTNEESIDLGIGPICRAKWGL